MNDAQNVQFCRVCLEDHDMGPERMQANGRVKFAAFTGDFGLFGQKGEQAFQRLKIVTCLLSPPTFDAMPIDGIKVGNGTILDRKPPLHRRSRSARKSRMSKGSDGPDASPSSTSA